MRRNHEEVEEEEGVEEEEEEGVEGVEEEEGEVEEEEDEVPATNDVDLHECSNVDFPVFVLFPSCYVYPSHCCCYKDTPIKWFTIVKKKESTCV